MRQGQQLVSGITRDMDTNVDVIAVLQSEVYDTRNRMDRLETTVREQGQCQEELLKAVLARLSASSEQHDAPPSEITSILSNDELPNSASMRADRHNGSTAVVHKLVSGSNVHTDVASVLVDSPNPHLQATTFLSVSDNGQAHESGGPTSVADVGSQADRNAEMTARPPLSNVPFGTPSDVRFSKAYGKMPHPQLCKAFNAFEDSDSEDDEVPDLQSGVAHYAAYAAEAKLNLMRNSGDDLNDDAASVTTRLSYTVNKQSVPVHIADERCHHFDTLCITGDNTPKLARTFLTFGTGNPKTDAKDSLPFLRSVGRCIHTSGLNVNEHGARAILLAMGLMSSKHFL
ncbi:hypothetical protein H4S04_007793 [Coemansia sp. S16]|nr:hypothetical protein H4S04_007793 [Coemansia sp. S16]KAJ2056601.1 hypothetical protein GGI08_003821 [Coemansia sp. S2]